MSSSSQTTTPTTVTSTVIGVDVGGTNTDVAILQGHQVIGWSKSSTTENITSGVVSAIKKAFTTITVGMKTVDFFILVFCFTFIAIS